MSPLRPARRRRIWDAARFAIEELEFRVFLSLSNGSFENSGLAGWTLSNLQGGGASAVVSAQGHTATDSSHFALLTTGEGSAPTTISQPFHAEAGDILTGQAFFAPGGVFSASRGATVQILTSAGASVDTLFSARGDSGAGSAPWTDLNYTFSAAGDYVLSASVSNNVICSSTTYLGLDAFNLATPIVGKITTGIHDYVTPFDTPLVVEAPGLLDKDSASTGLPITITGVRKQPTHGTLSLSEDGSFTYTPDPGYSGADSFAYFDSSPGSPDVSGIVHIEVSDAPRSTLQILSATPLSTDVLDGDPFQVHVAYLIAPFNLGAEPYFAHLLLPAGGAGGQTLDQATGEIDLTALMPAGLVPAGADSVPSSVTIQLEDHLGDTTSMDIPITIHRALPGFSYDLRFSDGSKSKTINPGDPSTYTLDLWARVYSVDDDFTNDGPSYGYLSVISSQEYGGALAAGGIVQGSTTPSFSVPAQTFSGAAANLSDDGIQDWGSSRSEVFPSDTIGISGYLAWLSSTFEDSGIRRKPGGTTIPGESQQVDAHTWEWRVATFTVTVDALGSTPGATTSFLPAFSTLDMPQWQVGFYRDDPDNVVRWVPRDVGTPVTFVLGGA